MAAAAFAGTGEFEPESVMERAVGRSAEAFIFCIVGRRPTARRVAAQAFFFLEALEDNPICANYPNVPAQMAA